MSLHFQSAVIKSSLSSLLAFLLSSCVSPHENFKAHMDHTVGKSIDDTRTWARPDRFLKSTALTNGNVENEYKLQRTCRYFFEYDPQTRIIVNWRFEGNESDCVINP